MANEQEKETMATTTAATTTAAPAAAVVDQPEQQNDSPATGTAGAEAGAKAKAKAEEAPAPKDDDDDAEGEKGAQNSDERKRKEAKKRRAWLPLESNPDVLTKYARALGAPPSSSFADVYGLDDELLSMVPGRALALLLLFPITKTYEERRVEQEKELSRLRDAAEEKRRTRKERNEQGEKEEEENFDSSFPYFTRQTIGNACGTVGLLHSFASIRGKVGGGGGGGEEGGAKGEKEEEQQSIFAPGSFFDRFYSATAAMTADERAEYLESPVEDDDDEDEDEDKKDSQKAGKGGDADANDDAEEKNKKTKNVEEKKTRAALAASIDAAHAAAATAGDTRPPGEDENVDLHFVAFVETGGRLWELDGRKVFPVDHGATSPGSLLRDAAAAIKKEFVDSASAEGSINFNLLALVEGADGGEGE